jgi:ABC-type phosphate/phosphonate transport system substrate-binding protein
VTLVANARMYSPHPAAAAAWRQVFAEVAARSGVALEPIDHPPPAPLGALWARDDLGAAFMCGFPFARAAPRPQLVAAPRRASGATYCTALVARAEAPFARLEDSFGGRIGWTVEESQSGWNAIRHLFPCYAERVGPLVTPRGVVEAVLDGRIDVGPLDDYALALLRRHAPALVAGLRVLATTRPSPIPPLVASPSVPADTVARLRDAFLALPPVSALDLAGFLAPDPAAYEVLLDWRP